MTASLRIFLILELFSCLKRYLSEIFKFLLKSE